MADILIVEDDIDIAKGLGEFLEAKGHSLDFAYNGKQALTFIDNDSYDLILLDLNLPQVDGLQVCRSLTADKLARIPVIMMTARGETSQVLTGFASGAWDYLVKPFSFAELSARMEVALARSAPVSDIKLEVDGVCLCRETLSITFKNKSLQLHQTGFEILQLLMKHVPQVVKTQKFHQQLWGDQMPDSDPLRAHIYKLRKSLASTFEQEFIKTVKGVGYRFDVEK